MMNSLSLASSLILLLVFWSIFSKDAMTIFLSCMLVLSLFYVRVFTHDFLEVCIVYIVYYYFKIFLFIDQFLYDVVLNSGIVHVCYPHVEYYPDFKFHVD